MPRNQENVWEYEWADSVGFLEINLGMRESGNTYFRGAEIKSAVVDKEKFFAAFIDFAQKYLEEQENGILEWTETIC